MLHEHTRVTTYDLHFSDSRVEGDQYAVTRWDTDDSILVGQEAYGVLRFLQKPRTIREIIDKTELGGKEVISFIHLLMDLHFIKELDGALLPDFGKKIHPWKLPVPRRFTKVLVNKNFLIVLLIFILSGLAVSILTPGYLPSYRDFFWSKDYLLVILSLFILGYVQLFLHELGHLLVTYAVGGVATMRFSRRFIDLVAETDSYHLAVVSKLKHYFVYFAGIGVDFLFISAGYWCMRLIDSFAPDLLTVKLFLKLYIVMLVSNIIWQYSIFLETDMYNALSEYLGIENLRMVTIKFLLHKIRKFPKVARVIGPMAKGLYRSRKVSGTDDDSRSFLKNKRTQLFLYSCILISGIAFAIIELGLFRIPREFVIVRDSLVTMISSFQREKVEEFMKAGIVIVLMLYRYVVLIFLEVRYNKKRVAQT